MALLFPISLRVGV